MNTEQSNMDKVIRETSRQEFEDAISKMDNEQLDDLLFEIRLRLSNIRSKIVTTQTNRRLAESEGNKKELEKLLKRLSALYSAEGWLKAKEMIANRELEKRIGPEATRVIENTVMATGEVVEHGRSDTQLP